ncbi:MAG: hypothetical protein IKB71_11890 [Lentisphaeria bacterium]|nr:hypothetical protein [Lentisphaeria bacterium]
MSKTRTRENEARNCRRCQYGDDGPGCLAYWGKCRNPKSGKVIIRCWTDGSSCQHYLKKGHLFN